MSDVDVAVVHLGGTRVLLHTVTMDATQGGGLPAPDPPTHRGAGASRGLPVLPFTAVTLHQCRAEAGYGQTLRGPVRGETLSS